MGWFFSILVMVIASSCFYRLFAGKHSTPAYDEMNAYETEIEEEEIDEELE